MDRIARLRFRLRIVSVAAAALVSLSWSGGASGLPLYASREGKTCIACHYDPNGGGMRNDFGFLYAKNRHGMDTEEKWSKVTIDPRLNDWVALGLDTRVLYLATHYEGASGLAQSTFFPMQGQFNIAISPHDYLTVVSSHGITIDPNDYQVRELYALVQGLPHDLFAQVGRFRLPFGLRQDDHTSFVRGPEFLPYNSQFDHAGIEIGVAGSTRFAQLSFTNPYGTISGERAQTLAGKIGIGGKTIAAGLSGFHEYREFTESTQDRWSLYAMSTHGRFTAIGEYAGGAQKAPIFFGGNMNLVAAFAELDFRAARGVNLRGKLDYLDRDRDTPDDLARRYTLEADLVPVPFMETKLSFRAYNDELASDREEYLVMFSFPL